MDEFNDESEMLLRCVRPGNMYWKDNDTLTSAAFKDPEGLSVDRVYDRELETAVETIGAKLEGSVVSVTVGDCHEANAIVKYKPLVDNDYHSEIHQSEKVALLTKGNARALARKARILKRDPEDIL